jgi:pyruvate/2-oxoglutarate dehydrogenase complex dihydrolipoamide acyltransferase (E2) component
VIPEVHEVLMPNFHDNMEAGKLLVWHKKVGDPVAQDEALADIETHLAIVELLSPQDGYVADLIHTEVGEGEESLVGVDKVLCLLVRKPEDIVPATEAYHAGELEQEKFKLQQPDNK